MRFTWIPVLAAAALLSHPARAQSASSTGRPVARPQVVSFVERRFSRVVRQKYDFSCGSAALATLLRYHYGRAVAEDTVFTGMWKEGDREQIRRLGFSLLDMKRYLAAQGLKSDGYKVTLDQIRATGLPGIALISVRNYRHFVVLKGVREDEVLLGDPSSGARVMNRAEFEQAWNGIYFVIDTAQVAGRRGFDRDLEWASFSRAPQHGQFTSPPSVQTWMLTSPFYRDF